MEKTGNEITTEEYSHLLKIKDYLCDFFSNYKYCAHCDKNVKRNSWYNHLKSSKHLKNVSENCTK